MQRNRQVYSMIKTSLSKLTEQYIVYFQKLRDISGSLVCLSHVQMDIMKIKGVRKVHSKKTIETSFVLKLSMFRKLENLYNRSSTIKMLLSQDLKI